MATRLLLLPADYILVLIIYWRCSVFETCKQLLNINNKFVQLNWSWISDSINFSWTKLNCHYNRSHTKQQRNKNKQKLFVCLNTKSRFKFWKLANHCVISSLRFRIDYFTISIFCSVKTAIRAMNFPAYIRLFKTKNNTLVKHK